MFSYFLLKLLLHSAIWNGSINWKWLVKINNYCDWTHQVPETGACEHPQSHQEYLGLFHFPNHVYTQGQVMPWVRNVYSLFTKLTVNYNWASRHWVSCSRSLRQPAYFLTWRVEIHLLGLNSDKVFSYLPLSHSLSWFTLQGHLCNISVGKGDRPGRWYDSSSYRRLNAAPMWLLSWTYLQEVIITKGNMQHVLSGSLEDQNQQHIY